MRPNSRTDEGFRPSETRYTWPPDHEYRRVQLRDLAPRTRSDYQRCLDYFAPSPTPPLVKFDRGLVVRIRDKAPPDRTPIRKYVKHLLSSCSRGARSGIRLLNPAENVRTFAAKKTRRKPIGHGPMKNGSSPRGRPGSHAPSNRAHDVLPASDRRTRCACPGRSTSRRNFHATIENGRAGILARTSALRAILDTAPKHDAVTLCANSNGRPWTDDGSGPSWRKVPHRVGATRPGCRLSHLSVSDTPSR